MIKYNIAVFVCVDEKEEDALVAYDQLGNASVEERRALYWKLAYTFCAVSMRVNPDKRHIVFTNDIDQIIIEKKDIGEKLKTLGVEIRYLPFVNFNPQVYANRLKNAFYKFEVISALGKEKSGSILLDTDCLWIQNNAEFDNLINGDELLLYDVYARSDTPDAKGSHGISMRDMGDLYKKIQPGYPCDTPVRYGGEVIAGSAKTLKFFSERTKEVLDYVIGRAKKGEYFDVSKRWNFLSGMELIASFVFNSGHFKIRHINEYIKRIWTYPDINNVSKHDMDFTIWHLIGEKQTGLNLLFYQALNQDSKFWKLNKEDLKYYIGQYCGIPKRKHGRLHPMLVKRYVRGGIKSIKMSLGK